MYTAAVWTLYDSTCDCYQEVDLTRYYGTYYYSGRDSFLSGGGTEYPIYKLKNGLATIHVHPYKTSSLEFSIWLYDPDDYDSLLGRFLALHLDPELVDNQYVQINPLDDNPFDGTEFGWATNSYPGGLFMEATLNDNCPELGFDNP